MGKKTSASAGVGKIIVAVVLLLFLCGEMISCGGRGSAADPFGLRLTADESAPGVEIRCYAHPNGEYYLFLPAGAYDRVSFFTVGNVGRVSVDGAVVKNGTANDVITRDGQYRLETGEGTRCLNVISSENLPALFLSTESGSLDRILADKEHKESGSFRLFDNGVISDEKELKSIKGRGNTTWDYDKKSFSIKFTEAVSLFGMPEAKNWNLLANAADPSLLRNSVSFALADEMGIPFVCGYQPVDLYVNGDYLGNYLLTEKVEVLPGRVEITDLDERNEAANPGVEIDLLEKRTVDDGCGSKKWTEIPASPDDITGGYLIEFDGAGNFAEENNGFITSGGQCVTVKSPKAASRDEIDYISRFCEEAEEALLSPDGVNSTGKHYSEYYDVSALAKMFILHEFLLNFDAGGSSCFFIKEVDGGKLTAACPWDFDASAGNYYIHSVSELFAPDTRCLPLLACNAETLLPTIYSLAYRHEDFRTAVGEQWRLLENLFSEMPDRIASEAERIAASAVCDFFRWNKRIIQTPKERKTVFLETYAGALERFFDERLPFAEREFSEAPALLFYDCNGAQGYVISEKMTFPGDALEIKGPENSLFLPVVHPEGKTFVGWNTKQDGSGQLYSPGGEIALRETVTVLYAQWE